MNHKFKVGDKGFLRDGKSEYEVMLIDPSVEKSLIVKITASIGDQYYVQHMLNGAAMRSGEESAWDMMPPEEFVWVNWLRHPTLGVATVAFLTEEKANSVDYSKSLWVIIKRAVKMKVPS